MLNNFFKDPIVNHRNNRSHYPTKILKDGLIIQTCPIEIFAFSIYEIEGELYDNFTYKQLKHTKEREKWFIITDVFIKR